MNCDFHFIDNLQIIINWFGEHPVAGNIISGVLNVLAIVKVCNSSSWSQRALNISHMVKRLVKGGKSIINSGNSIKNLFKKGPMIIGDFKDGTSKYIDGLVDGIGNVINSSF